MASLLFITSTSHAQFKNQKIETYKVSGNCNTCKKTIEKNGSKKNEAKVIWDVDTEIATISFDSSKTNAEEILKRIALTGYDNEKFLAPDNVYNKLESCCQYDRKEKKIIQVNSNMSSKHAIQSSEKQTQTKSNELALIYLGYENLKNSFITENDKSIKHNATELLNSIKSIEMNKLNKDEHIIWIKIQQNLIFNSERIIKSKNITKQREAFSGLSEDVYTLIKAAKLQSTFYYIHCPMFNNGKGANWISKENQVKNPYYGSQMISCGSIIETIK